MQRGGGDIRGGKKVKRYEELDCKDEDRGLTAFQWACKNGHYECARLLHEIGAAIDVKSDEGKTALQYAKDNKKEEIVKWFERGCEEEEEEAAEDEFPMIEGESAADRRRRIKAIRSGQEKFAKIGSKKEEEDEKEEEKEEDLEPGPEPVWDEVKECRKNNTADLICLRQESKDSTLDVSLFYCRQVNNLKLRMPAGALTALPPDLSHLKSLTTLIVSHNALTSLPAEIANLKGLKNLEFTDNKVERLPKEIESCEQLEVLDACRNCLTSVKELKNLHQLVTVKLDQNALSSLDGLAYKKLERLGTLSASHNEIKELDEKFSRLGALASLNLSNNKLKELPLEMGDMKEKVLLHINFDENPFRDSKIKKILEKGRAPVKELLNHLKKEQESGKNRKKKSKKESDDEEVDEEDEEEEQEAAAPEQEPEPVAVPQGGGGGGGGGKNKKKGKGKGGGGGGGGMTEEQKLKAREEAMRKLGMAPPPAPGGAAKKPDAPKAAVPAPAAAKEEEAADFDAGEEADEDDMLAFMTEGQEPASEESDDDLDDFLSDKPKETEGREAREARIARELAERKKASAANEKEKAAQKKAHEEWLASMDDETRQAYFAKQERERRAEEEALREAEIERERRRMEEMKLRAGATAAAAGGDKGGAAKDDRMENKWSYQGDKLVAEQVERKGPKKTVREIHIQFPTRKVGAIIGKAGVNIKIIEGKSNAKLNIHKPKVEPGEPLPDETLVTIKGRPEAVDKACETVNMVLAQFAAHRAAQRAKK